MIETWFFGFYAPSFRNLEGRIDPRLWFGHCEAWGFNADRTWVFIDPQAKGMIVRLEHRHDDVMDMLQARSELCAVILQIEGGDPDMIIPSHGFMTCASVCGSLVGLRALLPGTLKRKLLRNGAKVIHETEGRCKSEGGASA